MPTTRRTPATELLVNIETGDVIVPDTADTAPSQAVAPGNLPSSVPLPWLTGTVLGFGLIVAMALGLRLNQLSAYPLNPAEATQALVGYQILEGTVGDVSQPVYSPLMATFNSFFFLLFGAGDVSARLPAMLLGTALVALPFGLRQHLGLLGSLCASAFLAVSASSLLWSRTVNGDMAAAVGLLLLLLGFVHYLSQNDEKGLFGAVLGLVFLLLSSPAGYTALAVLALLTLLLFVSNRAGFDLLLARLQDKNLLKWLGGFGGLSLLILATAALFNISGLAAISDLLVAWFGQFGLTSPQVSYPNAYMLFLYEPALLIFGLIGISLALLYRHPLDWVLAMFVGLVLIFDTFMGGRSGGQILLAVMPLALLSGRVLALLWQAFQAEGQWEADGLFIGILLIVLTFIYITLSSWSRCTVDQAGCSTAWILPMSGLVLILGLSAIFWVWYGQGVVLRSLALALLVCSSLISLGQSWRLNFSPLEDLIYQPLYAQTPAVELPLLLAQIERTSAEKTGDARTLDMALVNLNEPLFRWYFRDFRQARFESSFATATGSNVILAPAESGQPLSTGYVGQDLAYLAHWWPSTLNRKDWIRWYFFRKLPNQLPDKTNLVLWVKM